MSLELKSSCVTIDLNVLDGYRALQSESEPDIVTELIDMFLADLPSRVMALRQAVEAGDVPATRRTAHVLKGAAATLGATALAGLCDYIEATARTGTVAAAAELLHDVAAESERTSAALLKHRRS